MKNALHIGLASLLFATTSASAITISGQAGKNYTHVQMSSGTTSPGLGINGDWTHSDNDGDVASLGLGLNLPLGPFMGTVGGKGVYTNPKNSEEGYAVAVGGGLQWNIANTLGLFGEYYYSPDSLSSGIKSYEEASAGARWTILPPLAVEVGYRFLDLSGKNGHRDNTLADGLYVGASAGF